MDGIDGTDRGRRCGTARSPADCPNPERNRYFEFVARRCGVPVYSTLAEATAGAFGLVAKNFGGDGETLTH